MPDKPAFILLGLDGAVPYILEEGLDAGSLPNFRRLLERGVYAHNIPFTSAVTPGNWAAIGSGARPAALGISDFHVHVPGEPLDQWHGCFDREWCLAEPLWESLSRQGKRCATISFPSGYPRSGEHHLAIGDNGAPYENSPFYNVAPARLLVGGDTEPADPYQWHEYERVELNPPAEWAGLPDGMRPLAEFAFEVKAMNENRAGAYSFVALIVGTSDEPCVVISPEHDYGKRTAVVAVKEWSDWIERPFQVNGAKARCAFRFRLITAGADKVRLFMSMVYPSERFSDPPEVSGRLTKTLGPYCDSILVGALVAGWYDADALLDDMRLQGMWQARAAVELVRRHGCAGVFTKWHAFDKFYHFFFHCIDPASPHHVPDQCDRYEGIHRKILGIADDMVGAVLDGMDDRTTLVVMSDHGLSPTAHHANLNNFLIREGYLAVTFEDGKPVVDWSQTRALMTPAVQIWINLKGRDPDGIVEPGAEYEALCGEIIEKLRGWRDPETGGYVLSDVFHISDGACYGLGGPRDGDIRVHTSPGYSLFRVTQPTPDGKLTMVALKPYLGDHGSMRPTARFGRGSERGVFFACGHGIRRVGKRAQPISPCDVVPTLCEIIRHTPPRTVEGSVLRDVLA